MPDEPLADRLLRGDRAAISEALNLVDDRRPSRRAAALELLDRLARQVPARATRRVGITGAPGVGKSTLLDVLVRELRGRDQTVGIIAVDPSSQRTGGALLGDRFRLQSSARDSGVFLRSMAARRRLGGLADATYAGTTIMATAFDWVFVETVGVGQSEADVAPLVDTLVFVAQPGAGDLLQFMKAGILELPDIFLVNKADLGPEAERTASELKAGLGLGERADDAWESPVLLASARDGQGVKELVNSLEAHRRHLEGGRGLEESKRRGQLAYLIESLESRYGSFGLERVGGREAVGHRLGENSTGSVFALAQTLASEIEAGLRENRA
jgi:LAO/AO transport system kinase